MATEQNMGETAKITLKTKLIQLGRVRDKWDNALKAGKEQVIQGHIKSLNETLKEVSKWYRTVKVEIVKAYIKEILVLPYTPSSNPKRILKFYEKLAYAVQSLETLKKLDAANGMVSITLEKLPNIQGDLVRNDTTWEEWTYVQLIEALRLWTRCNPFEAKPDDTSKRERQNQYQLQTQQGNPSKNKFVYIATKRAIDRLNAIVS